LQSLRRTRVERTSAPAPGVRSFREGRYAPWDRSADGAFLPLVRFRTDAVKACAAKHGLSNVVELHPGEAPPVLAADERADLVVSIDAICRHADDAQFERYMHALFAASRRFVMIYSSDFEDLDRRDGIHVRHRQFTAWIRDRAPDWILVEYIPNRFPYRGDYRTGSFANFYVYERS
jgi:hypothetical protein